MTTYSQVNAFKGGMGQATGVASGFGMNGTSGLYDSTDGFNGRAIGQGALKLGSACASGVSAFASATSTAGPAGAIAGTALGLIGSAVQGGLNVYDAQKTIALLEECRFEAHVLGLQDLEGIIISCMGKAKNKTAYGIANATVIGQPGVMIARTGRAIYKAIKGTKGKGRKQRAAALYDYAKQNDKEGEIARKAIKGICAASFEDFMKGAIANAMKS